MRAITDDKKDAVIGLLELGKSNRAVASLVGIAHTSVETIRKEARMDGVQIIESSGALAHRFISHNTFYGILRKLERCSRQHRGCLGCPRINECKSVFDVVCGKVDYRRENDS